MLILGQQGAQWSEDTPFVELTGGLRCPGVTMTKTRMWRDQEVEERGEEEVVWRGREWEGAGRGDSRPGKQEEAGRIVEPGL